MPRRALTSRTPSLLAPLMALALAPAALAGPLTPPAGPPAPTMKTLAEVEPRIAVGPATTPGDAAAVYAITQPGSYYLTGDVAGVAGKAVISIRTEGVTLDLNGFTITGVAGSGNGVDALLVGAPGGVTVRNGQVRACSHGVRLAAEGCLVEGITATGNVETGIVAGTGSRIVGCIASGNRVGIFGGFGTTVERCTAAGNLERGIHMLRGSTAIACTARDNGTTGISGEGDCTVVDCTASANEAQGFHFPGALNARNCTASENGQSGIMAGGGTIRDCSAFTNQGHGIRLDYAAMVEGCTASHNTGSGIVAFRSSRIAGCTTRRNEGHGVYVFTGCTVAETLCEENGLFGAGEAAGIYAEGSANRIEGNNLVANTIGIEAVTQNGGNFIARNTASYNPIRHRIAPGNNNAEWIVTPGEGFTTANPWANFGI